MCFVLWCVCCLIPLPSFIQTLTLLATVSLFPIPCICLFVCVFLFNWFLDRAREERKKKHWYVASHMCSNQGFNPQPKYMLCPGIEPATFFVYGVMLQPLNDTSQGSDSVLFIEILPFVTAWMDLEMFTLSFFLLWSSLSRTPCSLLHCSVEEKMLDFLAESWCLLSHLDSMISCVCVHSLTSSHGYLGAFFSS